MLHIISITEIKFKRLTRSVLGIQPKQEDQPTVEETIDLVREMQAIRPDTPAEPEADYGDDDDDLATPEGTTARRRSGGELWNKLHARGKRVRREQTLSRAFMKNFEKLANQIRTESTSESSPNEVEMGMKSNFRNFERKSLHTIVKMTKDNQYKDHILKRSKEAQRRWKRGVNKILGGKRQFLNVVEEAKDKKEEEEEEKREREAQEAEAAASHRNFLSPGGAADRSWASPSPSLRRNRRRQQIPEPDYLTPSAADFPGYAGGSPDDGGRGPGSRRTSRPSSGLYDSDVFH